jgi:hypothetical protein
VRLVRELSEHFISDSMKRPPEIQAIFDAITRGGPYRSIDQANRVIAARMEAYNSTPQEALGGLSPDQMNQLLSGDWHSTGALRVNSSVSIDHLRDVPFLNDALTLLRYVDSAGRVKETAAKNLPRAVVADLLPRLVMPTYIKNSVLVGEPAARNEQDVPWLSELRHTLMIGGLLMRRRGLRLTASGRDLMRDDLAGVLYALLFRTFFQRFNLAMLTRFGDHDGLQPTVAYSFYRLRSVARVWTSPQTLSESAWLESAKDPPTPYELQFGDLSHYTFRQRVLDPLVQFGLIERRVVGVRDRLIELLEYRLLPLFDRVLSFQPGSGGSQNGSAMPWRNRHRQ